MNSSGIKRGLAGTAVAALAVTGLPFLANSASAIPNDDASNIGADVTAFYGLDGNAISAKNDGTNTTVSLVANGGSNVTSVQFQYQVNGAGDYINIATPVARGTDGLFSYDWTPSLPAGTSSVVLRAVPNTGTTNADTSTEAVTTDTTTSTVELATEGPLGVFQSPYTIDGGSQWVGVTGTTSEAGDIDISALTGGTYTAGTTTATAPAPAAGADTTSFAGILDIDGYDYSAGTEGDQIAIGAVTNANTNQTGDAEGSTLYVQNISQVTAEADNTNIPAGSTATVTVTVLDQQGAPVANALVNYTTPDGADAGTDPDPSGVPDQRTDANGQTTFDVSGGKYTFFAETDAAASGYTAGDVKSGEVTVTEYTQQNANLVASSVKGFSAFDVDELGAAADDFVATLTDQNGNPVVGQTIQYAWTFDPAGPTGPTTGTYATAGTTDSKGQVAIPNPPTPGTGTYTLNVRRPNVAGSGLLQGTPVTVETGESEITWAEGDDANAPVNGSDTFDATLALLSGTPLPKRAVDVTYTPGADSSFAKTQPSGTKYNSGTDVDATTGTDGSFSVTVTDPSIPPNVDPTPEDGTLDAVASALQGAGDTADADAEDTLDVHFIPTPAVSSVDVSVNQVLGALTPGRPADLDIVVHGTDSDSNPANDPVLNDFPVTVSVDKGFLTPGGGHAANDGADMTLADGHDAAGDLYGYFQNDGAEKEVSTGDAGEADIAAAIERDPGFDDDGMVTLTVTVKAGDVTETKTLNFSSADPLNVGDSELARAAGEPTGDATIGDRIGFNLFVHDQFGNLVGSKVANITDDSTVADFDTDGDFGATQSDLTTSGVGIEAFSDGVTTQTLMASFSSDQNTVTAGGDNSDGSQAVTVTSDPINWVEGTEPPSPPVFAHMKMKGIDKGKRDVIKLNAIDAASGAQVKLFKRLANGHLKKIKTAVLNDHGNFTFRVHDGNGNKFTRYTVKLQGNDAVRPANKSRRVR